MKSEKQTRDCSVSFGTVVVQYSNYRGRLSEPACRRVRRAKRQGLGPSYSSVHQGVCSTRKANLRHVFEGGAHLNLLSSPFSIAVHCVQHAEQPATPPPWRNRH
eukprot:855678-Amphidinium_carterae.1